MVEKTQYFEWSDAWVLVALFGYDDSFQPIEISKVIAAGDMLNHAIFLPNELRRGFARLEAKEIIEIKESKLRLTPRGIEIRDNVRGGLFSIVDNTFKKLNSIKQETLSKTELRHFDFLSDKDIENEILKYKRRDGRK